MRSSLQTTWKNFVIITLFLSVLSPFSIEPARAQSQDREQEIQKLKDKLQQMDQMMGEVKAQIRALEQSSLPVGQQPATTAPPTIAARATEEEEPVGEKTFEIYGHVMLDSGYNFGQIDPDWFDVVRPTKLPAFKNQFGQDGSVFFSVRQTRFGVKSLRPPHLES